MRVLLFFAYDKVVADMTQQDWFQWYIANDAFWQHDGDMSRPHAETTSGLHTGTIFNSRILIENEFMLDLAVSDLLKQEDFFYIDTVAGPQTGATKLAQRIADKIGVHSVSPAKDIVVGKKRMVFETSDQEHVGRGKVVLLCEDTDKK